ncbi:uncharacterized protein CCR75_000228 [Bremia lactucae]|uniref:Uncharacterized protein n=1 Tax=Bremia lactucae TaxID=4779 RepID=A0A976FEE1_BRELC|nr:hypothetical protein CCR75_000228 [Bremia lactucae]
MPQLIDFDGLNVNQTIAVGNTDSNLMRERDVLEAVCDTDNDILEFDVMTVKLTATTVAALKRNSLFQRRPVKATTAAGVSSMKNLSSQS